MIKFFIIFGILFCSNANAKSRSGGHRSSHSYHSAASHRSKSFQYSNKAISYDRKYRENHKVYDLSQRNRYRRQAREENSKAINAVNR
jgi:hypothetical protein